MWFSCKKLRQIFAIINLYNYKIDIIDSVQSVACSSQNYLQNDSIKQFIKDIANIDYYHLSVTEAFTFIETISNKAKNILQSF